MTTTDTGQYERADSSVLTVALPGVYTHSTNVNHYYALFCTTTNNELISKDECDYYWKKV
jgi:hypothetical protein